MRVVRNFAYKKEISGWGGGEPEYGDYFHEPAYIVLLIKIIKELSDGCENIYEFLKNYKVNKSLFKQKNIVKQIEEEIQKAKIICLERGSEKEKIIKALEDCPLLNGTISFALTCTQKDIEDDFVNWETLDWNEIRKITDFFKTKFEGEHLKDFSLAYLAINADKQEDILYKPTHLFNPFPMIRYNLFTKEQSIFYTINNDKSYKKYVRNTIRKLLDKKSDEIIKEFLNNPDEDKDNWIYKFLSNSDIVTKYRNDTYKSFIAISKDKDNIKYYLIKRAKHLCDGDIDDLSSLYEDFNIKNGNQHITKISISNFKN